MTNTSKLVELVKHINETYKKSHCSLHFNKDSVSLYLNTAEKYNQLFYFTLDYGFSEGVYNNLYETVICIADEFENK